MDLPPPRKLPPKRDVVLEMLERGSLRLFIDPRRENVSVPKGFSGQAELVLRVGYELSPNIPDLEIGSDTIRCTLSFNRVPFACELPLAAIYAAIPDADGRGVVWPEDVPIESQLLKPAKVAKPKPAVAPKRSRPKPLKRPPLSEPSDEGSSTTPVDGEVKPSRVKLPPYLRVVK